MSTLQMKIAAAVDVNHHSIIGIPVYKDDQLSAVLPETLQQHSAYVQHIADQKKFNGKAGSMIQVPVFENEKLITIVLFGVGKKEEGFIEQIRRGVAKVVKYARTIEDAVVALFSKETESYTLEQMFIAAQLAYYKFDQYFTKKDQKNKACTFELVTSAADEARKALDRAQAISGAVNGTRMWVDMPPSDLTPSDVAQKAQALAKEYGLSCTIFEEEKLRELQMGGILGVSSGSATPPRMVVLEYSCGDKDAPTIAFVGKGITFDSGGLSLKPARFMETMKEDMAGAASVIHALSAIAQIKPHVNVVGCAALAENLPGEKAVKPGDVLKFYNGVTSEILNTDAEGRLVLADALSYVADVYKPAAMLDVATLTGACDYAVGPFFTAVMGNKQEIVDRVKKAGDVAGDPVWQLPFTQDYKSVMKSKIADLANICTNGRVKAGTITAGVFLEHFVGDTPWTHLDIASTAYDVTALPYFDTGATGSSVRLMIAFAEQFTQ